MNQELGQSVCLVIPLCNEEESLPLLGERLTMLQHSLGDRFSLRFLFINDGSTDRTRELLPGVVPPGIVFDVRSHAVNQGVGAAFRTAFRSTTEDIVCTIDADCSYGPEHLGRMIEEVAAGQCDVCVASPYHPAGGAKGVQRWRLLLSTNCSLLYRAVSPLKLYTYTSIFRAYRGSVARQVQFRRDDFIAAVEILLSAASMGCRISETPMVLRRRSAGVSKMRLATTILGHLQLLVSCLLARPRGYPSSCSEESEAPAAQVRSSSNRIRWSAHLLHGLGAHPHAAGPALPSDVQESEGALPR